MIQVMLLAAGRATRLRPLSLVRPKVLVPVMGTSVLEFWVRRLASCGCRKLVMNAFHLHQHLTRAVADRPFPFPVEVVVEERLLGTGGGIRNVLERFDAEPLCVINGDVLCDVPLERVVTAHRRGGAAVSLLVHDFAAFNNVAVDDDDRIVGFGERAAHLARRHRRIRLRAFTGIQVLEPEVLAHLPAGAETHIIDVYQDRIGAGEPPRALFLPPFFWREMGSVTAYWNLHRELAHPSGPLVPAMASGTPHFSHGDQGVGRDVTLAGMVVWGRGGSIAAGARLENVIAWDDVRVAAGVCIRNCILGDGVTVDENLHDQVITAGQGRATLPCLQ